MARIPKHRSGDHVGSWRLVRLLGVGGNAEVWDADHGADRAALKILGQRRVDSEPFQRFRREIEALQRIGAFPGVLPVLSSSIPSQPTRRDPAWLAMPIAKPIRTALGELPHLEEVVAAVSGVAETLARLEELHGLHHRDIKPDNLYIYMGKTAVGDFGLVEVPDADSLTAEGQWIGPIHYIAPEVLNNPAAASGPADVFSLAKTLWVLATGQRFPLPGHLPANNESALISSYIKGERIRALEVLVGSATELTPNLRPTMREMARELGSWVKPSASVPGSLDVDALRVRVAPIIQMQARIQEARDHRRGHLRKRLEEIRGLLEPLGKEMGAITGLEVKCDAFAVFSNNPESFRADALPNGEDQHHICMLIEGSRYDGRTHTQSQLVSGILLAVDAASKMYIQAAHVLADNHGQFRTVWGKVEVVTMESALEDEAINRAVKELRNHLPEAVLEFTDSIEGRKPEQPGSESVTTTASPRLTRAIVAAMRTDLKNLVMAQELYFSENGTYAPLLAMRRGLGVAQFAPSGKNQIVISNVSSEGWTAVITNPELTSGVKTCGVFVGPARNAPHPAATHQGAPVCW